MRAFPLDRYIFTALRRIWRWSPERKECLRNAQINGREPRWRCANCKGVFNARNRVIDHIQPVILPSDGFTNWDTYIRRLFCATSNLQCLCKSCHSKKSKEENRERRKAKKLKAA